MYIERQAREFAEASLAKRAYKLWRQATIVFKSERELEEEHVRRKEQIDDFFNNYKRKMAEEEAAKQDKEEREKLKVRIAPEPCRDSYEISSF